MPQARIYLVGAGPGDPGLITVKAVQAIGAADCIIYDSLANARLLEYARPGAETIYVGKSGSRPGRRREGATQAGINRLIIKKARAGKTVVRLKGGDPFIFGRGAEEAEEIVKAGLGFEVIPGVTSAVAAPAYAGIPLTHRVLASSVTFITGHEDPLKERPNIAWDRLSTGRGTLVFLMGWKNLAFICRKLRENGWKASTPAALVRWGTTVRQQSVVGRLDNIVRLCGEREIKPPVITVVGDVVRLKDGLDWFEGKPLFGRRVLVTRALEQAGSFARILEERGAEPVVFPTIKTTRPPSWAPLDRAIKRLSSYDWAIFTSVNGVRYFFERLARLGRDVRELKGVKLCAIGPMTERAITGLGIRVDITPKKYVAEAVIDALGRRRIKGKRFLLARAMVAREVLPTEIKRLGGSIDVVPAYRTLRPRAGAKAIKAMLADGEIDVATFTSSSTVSNFARLFKKGELAGLMDGVKVACIGPVTAATAEGFGLGVDICAETYTMAGLADAMAEYYTDSGTKNHSKKRG